MEHRYRLVRAPVEAPAVPALDASQQAVVDHDDGPLLVLAGPGTGKTTTLVEAVVRRVERGDDPDRVLVLTFSRKAADELRERIATRLRRTVEEPAAYTFHGFCHAIVRGFAPSSSGVPRLLSGAEREVRIRELLRGNAADDGLTRWPDELKPALTLRGFAREVADLLDRARERGLDSADLIRLGRRAGRPAWTAAGEFLEEYLEVLDAREELDYAGLVTQATALLDGAAAELCNRFTAVYVDEYQDTDPSQERLLRRLAGGGRLLVAVGDPDQSVYGFRGADLANITEFPRRFPRGDGKPSAVHSLGTCRRMGPELLAVSRELARRIPLGELTRERKRHRGLAAAGPPASSPPQVLLFPTVADEVTAIADILRRAHLVEGMRWDQMAVLVRSGVRSIAVLRRALVAAGVPVAVAADEVPLSRDPAVAPLIGALQVALSKDWSALTPDLTRVLLLSPLGRATPAGLRALGRRLRALDRASGETAPRPSSVLIRDAVVDGLELTTLEDWVADPARRLSRLLTEARRLVQQQATPEEVLWSLWDGSGWARRLSAAATTSGAAGRGADRDLDAVVALFEVATRLEDRRPRAGVSALLEEIEAQEIPAAPLEERVSAQGAVRLLTAHRSKGLEWDLVVVSGVQDGVWPDLRRRGSLLDADSVDRDQPRPEPSAGMLLAEERRLFYVAVTRARRRLVVTAVSGVDDESDRPSRFLDELGLAHSDVTLSGTHLLSPGSLVARLRRALIADDLDDSEREEAAAQLAALAAAVAPDGSPLVPAARPDRWWGVVDPTTGPEPVRRSDARVALSGSAVSSFQTCPRRWFLDREVHAQGISSSSQGFGSVVHALAEAVATGELPADVDALMVELDSVWRALPFDAEWQRDREHDAARELLARFVAWHTSNSRTLLGAEVEFAVDYGDDVVLRGRADRLELADDGGLVVVDLKTSKYPPRDKELPTEPQLGVYQLAVREGGFAERHSGAPGGAELVQLRKDVRGKVKVQPQDALGAGLTWIDDVVTAVARDVRAETFAARPNDLCDRCAYRTSCPAVDAGAQVVE